MDSPRPILTEEPPLPEYTESVRRNVAIAWYRTPLPTAQFKELHERSDLRASWQTLGYLGILASAAAAVLYSSGHWPWWMTASLFFVEGTFACFFVNGVHELGHGTVFKTKKWNGIFCHVLAFIGWFNHELFQSSHIRHHRYTLHPPDDLEVTQPIRIVLWHVFREGIFSFRHVVYTLQNTWRIARGRFAGEWELTLYPENSPDKRRAPVRWARILLAGHGAIWLGGLLTGYWMVPVVLSMPTFAGGWLFFFCNNTQHVGLQDNVDDFRLCCRTFTLNPFVRFLYWQMNYHTEHHMYAAVPCYHLARLHQLVRHDLPPTPHGLVAVWREIAEILARQEEEPSYRHVVQLPAAGS